ncbi:hypothetical protein [Roseateles sp.]|nr:hypothetical protein [Roseateles sp.]
MFSRAIPAMLDRFAQKQVLAARMTSTLQTGDDCARPTDADS